MGGAESKGDGLLVASTPITSVKQEDMEKFSKCISVELQRNQFNYQNLY